MCKFTPVIEVKAPIGAEIVARLTDEAVTHERMCISLKNMVVDMALSANSVGSTPFGWTQPMDLSKISVMGNYDCVNTPDCTPDVSTKINQNFVSSDWTLTGQTKIAGSNNMQLNDASGSGSSGAFLKEKQYMLDDWEVEYTYRVKDISTWFPMGGQWGFVAQNTAENKKPGDWGFEGMGSESIGFMHDIWATYEINAYKGGNIDTAIGSSQAVDFAASGSTNTFKVVYSAASRVLSIYEVAGSGPIPADAKAIIIVQLNLNVVFPSGWAWIGFGTNIGTGSGSQIEARSFKFKTVSTSILNSVIEEDKLTVKRNGILIIDAKTSCSTVRFSGGDKWVLRMYNSVLDINFPFTNGDVIDNGDGTYKFNCFIRW